MCATLLVGSWEKIRSAKSPNPFVQENYTEPKESGWKIKGNFRSCLASSEKYFLWEFAQLEHGEWFPFRVPRGN